MTKEPTRFSIQKTKILNNKTLAPILIIGLAILAVIGFIDEISNIFTKFFPKEPSIQSFALSGRSRIEYADEKKQSCIWDGQETRSLWPVVTEKLDAIELHLNFYVKNPTKQDWFINQAVFDILKKSETAGGAPGILTPKAKYRIEIEHKVGKQKFELVDFETKKLAPFIVPGGTTEALTLVINLKHPGVGLCFRATVGLGNEDNIAWSSEFDFILSRFTKDQIEKFSMKIYESGQLTQDYIKIAPLMYESAL